MSRHPSLAGLKMVLGGNVFGWTANEDTSFEILDAFYEAGGRMIDTAEVYSAWVPGHKGGESETVIGNWMKARGVRKDMRIATKTGVMAKPGDLKPEKLRERLAGSLERLQTDYVDLYYAHRDDPETPQDEVAAGFAALIADRMVREAGASNFTEERLRSANDVVDDVACRAGRGYRRRRCRERGHVANSRPDFLLDQAAGEVLYRRLAVAVCAQDHPPRRNSTWPGRQRRSALL